MKIVDVRTVIVDGGWRNWVFVVVDTDERLTGYGECTLEGREHAVVGVVQDFRHHLVGENPENIRRLTRQLGRHGYWESGPVISSGIGGVEMALWDAFAKSLGVSLNSLLGGPLRSKYPFIRMPGISAPSRVMTLPSALAKRWRSVTGASNSTRSRWPSSAQRYRARPMHRTNRSGARHGW